MILNSNQNVMKIEKHRMAFGLSFILELIHFLFFLFLSLLHRNFNSQARRNDVLNAVSKPWTNVTHRRSKIYKFLAKYRLETDVRLKC